jgi:hypothetical protein
MGKYTKILIGILLIFIIGCSNSKFDPTTTIIKQIYKNKN